MHPRPDLLGRLGRHGRGEAPLILCTEILRSTRETEDKKLLRRLQALDALIEIPNTPESDKKPLRTERAALQSKLAKRNVEIYGAITLRTDGKPSEWRESERARARNVGKSIGSVTMTSGASFPNTVSDVRLRARP